MKQCLALGHVQVETLASRQTLVDRPLAQLGAKRSVVLSLPYFLPAIYATAHTDLILTIPRRLAIVASPIRRIRLIEPPREIKAFPYFMAWHPRLTNEPAHAWFRHQLRTVARSL